MVDHTAVHGCDAGQREERSGGRNWSGETLGIPGPFPEVKQEDISLRFASSLRKASRPTVFCTD
jgi:hypothetical protein